MTVRLAVGHFLGEIDGEYHIRQGHETLVLATDAELAAWAAGTELGPGYAKAYRLRPLQSVLGFSDGRFVIGTVGGASILVDEFTRDLWWWAGPSPDLESLFATVASVRAVGVAQVAEYFLRHAPDLLAAGAAYLDHSAYSLGSR
jgi:hypothetical protein